METVVWVNFNLAWVLDTYLLGENDERILCRFLKREISLEQAIIPL